MASTGRMKLDRLESLSDDNRRRLGFGLDGQDKALTILKLESGSAGAIFVAVATADVGGGDLDQVLAAHGRDGHPAAQPQQAALDAGLEHEVGAGVGAQDGGDGAGFAQVGPPGL